MLGLSLLQELIGSRAVSSSLSLSLFIPNVASQHTKYSSDSQSSKTVRWISILSRLAMLINGSALLSDSTMAQSKSISIPELACLLSDNKNVVCRDISVKDAA
ncbi:hypothetical protein BX070DRAFT_221969, partial [Coemansia spiralis]